MTLADLRSRVGQDLGISDWLPITQARVDAFADATGDRQFIHVDPERAAGTPFGGTVAHGFLTLALLAGDLMPRGLNDLSARMVLNYGLNRVRFVTPVRVGARVRSRAVLTGVEEGPGHAQLTLTVTVDIEGEDRPALAAEWLARVYF